MQRVASDKFIVNITFAWEHAVAVTDAEDAGKLVSHRFPQFSFRDGLDPSFFKYAMLDKRFKKHLELSSPGGAGRNRVLKIEDMLKYRIAVPSIEEQQKVSWLLDNVNDHIVYAETELNKWKELKKGMLQKMFPKEGESVPEIRFQGFTEPWEEHKYGDDIESIQTGTNLLGSKNNTGIPLIKMGNIQRGYFDVTEIERIDVSDIIEAENIVYYGDFFFNTRNTLSLVGKGATWMGENGMYAFNSNIARVKLHGVDTIFFNYLYNTDSFSRQIHASAMGTTSVAAIYPRSLESVRYFLPTVDEQKKIGKLFQSFDRVLNYYQDELSQWQTLKKALLQQMFV